MVPTSTTSPSDYVWGVPAVATPMATFLRCPGQQHQALQAMRKHSSSSLATIFDDHAAQEGCGLNTADTGGLDLDTAAVEALLKTDEDQVLSLGLGHVSSSDLDCMSPTTQGSMYSTATESALAALCDEAGGGGDLLLVRTATLSSPAEEAFLSGGGGCGKLADLVPAGRTSRVSSDVSEEDLSDLDRLTGDLLQGECLAGHRGSGIGGAVHVLASLQCDEALAAMCSYVEAHLGPSEASEAALDSLRALQNMGKRSLETEPAAEGPAKRVKAEMSW